MKHGELSIHSYCFAGLSTGGERACFFSNILLWHTLSEVIGRGSHIVEEWARRCLLDRSQGAKTVDNTIVRDGSHVWTWAYYAHWHQNAILSLRAFWCIVAAIFGIDFAWTTLWRSMSPSTPSILPAAVCQSSMSFCSGQLIEQTFGPKSNLGHLIAPSPRAADRVIRMGQSHSVGPPWSWYFGGRFAPPHHLGHFHGTFAVPEITEVKACWIQGLMPGSVGDSCFDDVWVNSSWCRDFEASLFSDVRSLHMHAPKPSSQAWLGRHWQAVCWKELAHYLSWNQIWTSPFNSWPISDDIGVFMFVHALSLLD